MVPIGSGEDTDRRSVAEVDSGPRTRSGITLQQLHVHTELIGEGTMRRTTTSITHLAMLTLLFGCASAPRVNMATEEQAIRELDASQARAIAARDVDAATASYGPNSWFLMSNAPLAAGRDAIRGTFTEFLKTPNLDFTFTPTRVEIAKAGDMAYDVGTYRMSFDSPQGKVVDEGNFTTVWKKVDGRWMIASDNSVSSKPMPAPPMAMAAMDMDKMEMQAGAGMTWSDMDTPGFKPGAKMAVVHGDPSSTGDYIIRVKFPDGYEFPAHWHPNAEHVTVLQGTFMLGMGRTFDRSALQSYMPGDFVYAPAKAPHFGAVKGETIIQLNGVGPFAINMVK